MIIFNQHICQSMTDLTEMVAESAKMNYWDFVTDETFILILESLERIVKASDERNHSFIESHKER